ncbi:sialidase family protein [Caldilinea sp.]|uniref:sialidase family protein n=1 Tax=Caldilinea sp. TaxID=2293560 RepID=UPI002B971B4B|nr:sialidase family protein [Caldilinea sp.]
MAPTESFAQSSGWSAPVALGAYWFPDVAVDGSGRVHTVWSSGGDGFDTVMYAAKTEDIWSRPVDIIAMPQIAGGSEASRPTLMVDAANNLHLTYRYTTVYYSQAPAGGAGVPGYWRPPFAIEEGYFSRLARDSQGVLHLVFTQNVQTETCRICYHVFYVRSMDDGFMWSDPVDISVQATGAAKPQLIIDSQDNLHVVWEAGYGGSYGQLSDPTSVVYAMSDDAGNSWTRPYTFDPARGKTTDSMARNITIAQDGNGHLVTVWWAIPEDIIFYQLSMDGGQTWSAKAPVPNVLGIWALYQSRLDDYATAVDSAGRIHLVMVGRRNLEQTRSELLHVVWDGSNWSNPDVIASYAGDMPEWPRIAVGLGNQLHVVWFVRDAENIFNSDAGNYQVWYATGATDSPAIAPVAVLDIPPPLPVNEVDSISSEILPLATSQIKPVVVDDANAPSQPAALLPNIQSENDEVFLLLLATAPVLALIAVAAAVFSLQRRRRIG